MTRVRARGEEIRRFILDNVQKSPRAICKVTSEKFDISRQAVNTHLNRLVEDGALKETGKTKNKMYELAPIFERSKSYSLATSPQPAEDLVWREDVAPALGNLPDNVGNIWFYGFTEMFNNAKDHSGGTKIEVTLRKTAVSAEMWITDDGVGIFKKIQQALNLQDERHALFELSKGKLTTDPDRHSGEGIFFTSRVFDKFYILSGNVIFDHEFGEDEDWIMERAGKENAAGTTVYMQLSNHTARTTKKVFSEYAGADEFSFSKTVVPVQLAQYGNDQLVSRSQAKRVMARVDMFKTVVLNFKDVPTIGQGFADEVFRVFRIEHPDVDVLAINANEEVQMMIGRVRAAANEKRGPQGVS